MILSTQFLGSCKSLHQSVSAAIIDAATVHRTNRRILCSTLLTTCLSITPNSSLAAQQLAVLAPGWNLLGVQVQPADNTPQVVFADLIASNRLCGVHSPTEGPNIGWQVFSSTLAAQDLWLNSLNAIEAGHGYFVCVTSGASVEIQLVGELAEVGPRTLGFGWHLLSLGNSQSLPWANAMGSLTGMVSDVYSINPGTNQLYGFSNPKYRQIGTGAEPQYAWVYSGEENPTGHEMPIVGDATRTRHTMIEGNRAHWIRFTQPVSFGPNLDSWTNSDVDSLHSGNATDNGWHPDAEDEDLNLNEEYDYGYSVRVATGELGCALGGGHVLNGYLCDQYDRPVANTQDTISFRVPKGALHPALPIVQQEIQVRNDGSGVLRFSIDEDIGWLHVEPAEGEVAPSSDGIPVILKVDLRGLLPGSVPDEGELLTVRSSGGSREYHIKLSVPTIKGPYTGAVVVRCVNDPACFAAIDADQPPSNPISMGHWPINVEIDAGAGAGTLLGSSLHYGRDVALSFQGCAAAALCGNLVVPADDSENPYGLEITRSIELHNIDWSTDGGTAGSTLGISGKYKETISIVTGATVELRGVFNLLPKTDSTPAQTRDMRETPESALASDPSTPGFDALAAGAGEPRCDEAGQLFVVGSNRKGQLGLPHTPVPGQTVVQLAAGRCHALALTEDGSVWAWGCNDFGQLGNGTVVGGAAAVRVLGISDIVEIAAGFNHSLARGRDGTVWAWGDNERNQLATTNDGNQGTRYSAVPLMVLGLSDAVALAAGADHSLVLLAGGVVKAWGAGDDGQLGNGLRDDSAVPVSVLNLINVRAISAGHFYSIALRQDGTVWCWGVNSLGRLGNGVSSTRSEVPTQVVTAIAPAPVPLSGIIGIKAGPAHGTAIAEPDGRVWVWGDNSKGQLGVGDTISTFSRLAIPVPSLSGVLQLCGGGGRPVSGQGQQSNLQYHTIAVVSSGAAFGWGANGNGQLGNQSPPCPDGICRLPVAVPDVVNATMGVACGGNFTLHLTEGDGEVGVTGFGRNDSGELGTDDRSSPWPITCRSTQPDDCLLREIAPIIFASAGLNSVNDNPGQTLKVEGAHSAVVTEAGTLWTWGDNSSGQLGDGTRNTRTVPRAVAGLVRMVGVAAGGRHTLGLRDDGTVWAWGDNNRGQLGDRTTNERLRPVQVLGLPDGIVGICAGVEHSLAVAASGSVWAWGSDLEGQLGDGGLQNAVNAEPIGIANLPNVKHVACGGFHSLAIQEVGQAPNMGYRLLAWGRNVQGQIGNGGQGGAYRSSPEPVYNPGAIQFIYAAGGTNHSVALDEDGHVWAWGLGAQGQLGLGSPSNSSVPMRIDALQSQRVTAIAAGTAHTLATTESGRVFAWGDYRDGRLGFAASANVIVPTEVALATPASGVAAGGQHSLFYSQNHYGYVTAGFKLVDDSGLRSLTFQDMVFRHAHTSYPFHFSGTPQQYYDSLILPDEPERMREYIRLQAIGGNEELLYLTGLPYAQAGPELAPVNKNTTRFIKQAIQDRAEPAVAQMTRATSLVPFAHVLDDCGDDEGSGPLEDLVRAVEIKAKLQRILFYLYANLAFVNGPDSAEKSAAMNLAGVVAREVALAIAQLAPLRPDDNPDAFRQRLSSIQSIAEEIASAADRLQHEVFEPAPNAGDNPSTSLTIPEFVPNPARGIRDYWDDACQHVRQAIDAWREGRDLSRQFDMDQTALRTELRTIGERYLDRLETLTGVDPRDSRYVDVETRIPLATDELILKFARDSYGDLDLPPFGNFPGGEDVDRDGDGILDPTSGQIGIQITQIQRAALAMGQSIERLRNIPRLIAIEQQRQNGVAQIQLGSLGRLRALDIAQGYANAYSYSESESYGFSVGTSASVGTGWSVGVSVSFSMSWSKGTNFSPGSITSGYINAERRTIETMQQVAIEGIESKSRIRTLLLDMATAGLAVEEARKEFEAATRTLRSMEVEFNRVVRDYQQADEDLASAYFSNPTYRIEADRAQVRSDVALRRAKLACIRAARRMEYAWAENFTNDTLDTLLNPEWQPFTNALAALEVMTPFELADFLEALAEWDRQMVDSFNNSQLVLPGAPGNVARRSISFRRHILGLDDWDADFVPLPQDELQRRHTAFSQYVQENLHAQLDGFPDLRGKPALQLVFPINLASPSIALESYFSPYAEWNHKIESLAFNLVGSPSTSFKRGPMALAKVYVLQRGTAAIIRHGDTPAEGDAAQILEFDADPWKNWDDPWGQPNAASYTNGAINLATSAPLEYQSQDPLKGRAVSATEWTVIVGSAPPLQHDLTLNFEYLRDIELFVGYRHGAPEQNYTPLCVP